MTSIAQVDLKTRGREARIRALLEDLVRAHITGRPQVSLALAVWYRKSPERDDQYVLELLSGFPSEGVGKDRLSLLWKTGQEGPPYANVSWMSTDHFLKLASAVPEQVREYQQDFEVLHFDKSFLTPELSEMFRILTEPPGLIKGWCVDANGYESARNVQVLLSRHAHSRPEVALVKIWESPDFEYCRGILHVLRDQKWLPLSPDALRAYSYYGDWQTGKSVYFLFEGGSVYRVMKYEVKAAPGYAEDFGLLGRTPDDRYPEVYLRAVRLPAESAA